MKKSILSISLVLFCISIFAQVNSKFLPKNGTQDFAFNKTENKDNSQQDNKSKSVYFSEDFETDTLLLNWTLVDADNDSNNWVVDPIPFDGPYDGIRAVVSDAWNRDPDNWLISPAIDLSTASDSETVIVEFFAESWAFTNEFKHHFSLKLSTTGNDTADFQVVLFDDEVMDIGMKWKKFVADVSSYSGDTIYLAWQHHNSGVDADLSLFLLDGISVKENTSTDIAIMNIVSPNNDNGCRLNDIEYPIVTLFNYGGESISNFSVKYLLPGGTLITETVTDTLPTLTGLDYTFSTPMDFSILGYYDKVLFMVSLTGDEYNDNNAMYTDVDNTDAKLTLNVQKRFCLGADWKVTNSAGIEVKKGEYNPFLIGYDTTNVCLLSDDCYIFELTGSLGGNSTWIELIYNDSITLIPKDSGNTNFGIMAGGIGETCLGTDVSLNSIDLSSYQLTGSVIVKGELQNMGADSVNSLNLNYTIDNGTIFTDSITGLGIASGYTYDYTHSVAVDLLSVGTYKMKLWVSNINGTIDEDNSNDTLTFNFYVSSNNSAKRVLLEEATGAWCGYCPDGAIIMNNLAETNSQVIGVALHNKDAMSFTDGNTVNSEYISGYPSGMVDRKFFNGAPGVALDRESWTSAVDIRINQSTPVTIGFSSDYNSNTRVVTIDLTAKFVTAASGDIRFNCYIVEDSVIGSGTGYDQSNYYNSEAGHPLYGLGDPYVGYAHRHVARALLGGAWGTDSNSTGRIIPLSVDSGATYTHQYIDTLPAAWDESKISIVGFVQQYNSSPSNREILNANEAHLGKSTVSIKSINKTARQIFVYPNPAKDMVRIENVQDAQIELYSIYGRLIKRIQSSDYIHDINITDLSRGSYIIRVGDQRGITTKKIIVVK